MELTLPVVLPGLLIWISILLLPWRPWSVRESLDSQASSIQDLSNTTVLIPARNEALTIAKTLTALKQQGPGLKIILVDDQSEDNTVEIANGLNMEELSIIQGSTLPEGWSGKLWALEQGQQQVNTENLLLLDADIVLLPDLIPTLLEKMQKQNLGMLSLMANLRMVSFWERLLMPAFIFFFKLLYPFHLSNNINNRTAAAAGGCILLKTKILEELEGFKCIKDALIDDCSLAKQIKLKGHKIWIGLTHSAISIRHYDNPGTIWHMVTRTAYTQLAYSLLLLLLCTLLMFSAFMLPMLALFASDMAVILTGLLTLLIQSICYLPCLRYYSMNPLYTICLSFIGISYLIMTWHSAFRYYFGKGANWKGRNYN